MGTMVFIIAVLTIVLLFFYFLRQTDRYVAKKEQEKMALQNIQKEIIHDDPTDEAAAAIALAISMYKIQQAEEENLRVTIQKVSKIYSPWSSKIYTLRQLPK